MNLLLWKSSIRSDLLEVFSLRLKFLVDTIEEGNDQNSEILFILSHDDHLVDEFRFCEFCFDRGRL